MDGKYNIESYKSDVIWSIGFREDADTVKTET
jgi:hypothetical protein